MFFNSIRNIEIKYGTTRTVFLFRNLAIKIPNHVEWRLFLHGLLANMQETKFSKTGWPELCPILFSIPGGFLNIMKRARPLTREEFFSLNVDEWREKEDYIVPCENKLDNFGCLDGRIVTIDYGS